MKQFFDTALEVHESLTKEKFGDHVVRRADIFPATYIWIVDGKEAIFAMPRFHSKGLEIAFQTTEPSLIQQLDKDWESAFAKSSPI